MKKAIILSMMLFLLFSPALWLVTDVRAQRQDTTPPKLVEFSFTPTTIDISTQDQTVTVTLQITDDFSGFSSGRVYFTSPSRNLTLFGFISGISGDELNGTYQALITIPRSSEIGIWQVGQSSHLVDFAKNRKHLLASELAAMGFPTELEVK